MRTGKIIQVSGSVVDVRFPHGELPRIREALSVELNGKRLVMEVEQHLSAERCAASCSPAARASAAA